MKNNFITSRDLGLLTSFSSLLSPLVSSPQSRIVLFSSSRHDFQVRTANGAVVINPAGLYNQVFIVKRSEQRTVISIDCGCAKDASGYEYNIICTLDFGFTVKDEALALEKIVTDFDSEYKIFIGFLDARMRKLVHLFIERKKVIHSALDIHECCQGLAREAQQFAVAFEVLHVFRATFGDPDWRNLPSRRIEQQEAEAEGIFKQRLSALGREVNFMQASQVAVELQRDYALHAEQFRQSLEAADSAHKIAKLKNAIDQLGGEIGPAAIDPITYSLITGHRERMKEIEWRALEKFSTDLVDILKRRIF